MKTKTFSAVFALIFLASNSYADSKLCGDAVEAVCDQGGVNQSQLSLAKKVSSIAVRQTQAFLKEDQTPPADFLASIRDGINHSFNSETISVAMTRGLAYVACLDFLSRGYFSSEGDYSYMALQCFPNGPARSQESLKAAIDRLGDVTQQAKALKAFNEIKSLTLRVVNESGYAPGLKPELIDSVQKTELMSVKDFVISALTNFQKEVEKDPKISGATPQVVLSLLSACDPTGKSQNAFNYPETIDPKIAPTYVKHNMVICPAMWIYGTRFRYRTPGDDQPYNPHAMARDGTYVRPPVMTLPEMDGNPDNLIFVVGHEMGHSIDILIQDAALSIDLKKPISSTQANSRSTMNSFMSCMKDRHMKNGELIAKQQGLYNVDKDTSALLFFNEYHADSVSANVLSLYLKKLSPKDRDSMIVNNLKMFCGRTKHDDWTDPRQRVLHPSGEFRIATTFLGNAQLRKTLGCTQAPKVFGCSFR